MRLGTEKVKEGEEIKLYWREEKKLTPFQGEREKRNLKCLQILIFEVILKGGICS